MQKEEKEFWIGCRKGDLEKVKELSKHANNVNWANEKKKSQTGLHIACYRGRREVVEYLLTLPLIQFNVGDADGKTPLHVACESGKEEIVKILLKNERVDVNKGNIGRQTPLCIACVHGRSEGVKIMLKDVRVDVNQGDQTGRTPLYCACFNRNEKITKILLRDGRIKVNQVDYSGITPLWDACSRGREDFVKILLASRKEIDVTKRTREGVQNWNGLTAEKVARNHGYDEIAELVNEYGRNPQDTFLRLRKELGNRDFMIFSHFSFHS